MKELCALWPLTTSKFCVMAFEIDPHSVLRADKKKLSINSFLLRFFTIKSSKCVAVFTNTDMCALFQCCAVIFQAGFALALVDLFMEKVEEKCTLVVELRTR